MELLHVRHATSLITYGGVKFLVDPVLSEKEVNPPINNSPCQRRNPLVDLSTPMDKISEYEVVLCTHIHGDHFDKKAKELLDKSKLVICQKGNEKEIKDWGFEEVVPVVHEMAYKGITITRVDGKHGRGGLGKRMGKVSGFILSAPLEPTVYLTGDTVFNEIVEVNLANYQPDLVIINGGSARFLNSDPIVMNIADIEETINSNPNAAAKYVIVHLETFNHCVDTRIDIKNYFTEARLEALKVAGFYVPNDNEILTFS